MVRNNGKRLRAIALRQHGRTYTEISEEIGGVPKGTLAYWMRTVVIPQTALKRMTSRIARKLVRARRRGQEILRGRRKIYFSTIRQTHMSRVRLLKNPDIAKLILATLYLAEGGKTQKGSLMFGNSDPGIIRLFLHLLRFCYRIDAEKFRCTVQGRRDQHGEKLERFWSLTTGIPRSEFYAFRADPRSQGKRTRKKEYLGVCRIDYFSAAVFHDLMILGRLLCEGL